MRRALLIGINQYPGIPSPNLKGCVSDMELMRSLLTDRFGFPAETTRTLRNEEATQQAIRGALADIAATVGEDDIVVLFYAGHGSRMLDPRQPDPRQPGRLVESMVPYDSGRGTLPNLDILDEEIDQWVQRVNEKTPHVTLIFDCCHSGSVTRDPFGEATREAPADLRAPADMFGGGPLPEVFTSPRDSNQRGTSGWLPGRRRAVVIAACRADEFANEHKAFTGTAVVRHGALTFFLGQALLQAQSGATWRDLFEQAAPRVTAKYSRQHPQIEGKMDQLLFGTEEIRPASYLQVLAAKDGTVELGGGAAHGLRTGSLWTVRSAGARHGDAGDEVATVEIQTVHAVTSTARVVETRPRLKPGATNGCPSGTEGAVGGAVAPLRPSGRPFLAPGFNPGLAQLAASGLRAFLREQRLPEPGLQVAIDAPEEPRSRFLQALEDEPLLRFVEEAEEADLLIRWREEKTWSAIGRDGRFAARLRPDHPEEIRALLDDLRAVVRYRQLLEVDNPDPESRLKGRVHLRVRGGTVEGGVAVFREGEKAEFEIVNDYDAPVWVTLVEFGSDGKISLLLPRPGHATYARGGMQLAPGQILRLAADYYRQDPRYAEAVRDGLPLHLPKGFPWAAEPGEVADLGLVTLKLLITPASADFEFLEQAAPRDGLPADIAPEMDWASVTLPIGVRRQAGKHP
jgi:hypothetical protein